MLWAACQIRAKRFWVPVFLFTLLVCTPSPTVAQDKPQVPPGRKNVLVLHAHESKAPVFVGTDKGLSDTLQSGGIAIQNQFFVSLDLRRNPSPEYRKLMVEQMRLRYPGRPPDMIVTMYPEAMEFVLRDCRDVFPGVPILALYLPEGVESPGTNRTVVRHSVRFDIAGTVGMALQLVPRAKRVYVVSGAHELDKAIENQARQDLRRREDRLEFRYLSGMPFEDMLAALSTAPADAIVLLLIYAQDLAGKNYNNPSLAQTLSEVSTAPIFGLLEASVGYGIVGGSVVSFPRIGSKAGELVLDILRGTPTGRDIPGSLAAPPVPMFDWRELNRWNLNESALPKGSAVINRELILWDFRYYIIAALAFILAEFFLIAGLIAHKKRRAKAEKSLKERLQFERLISDISARFLNIAPDKIDREIEGALKGIVDFFHVSHTVLIKGSPEGHRAGIIHAAHADDVPPTPLRGNLNAVVPWTSDWIAQGKVLSVTALEELPAEAAADREFFVNLAVKSLLIIPIIIQDSPKYAIGISSRREQMVWPEDYIPRMGLLGQMLVNTLERQQAEVLARQKTEELDQVFKVSLDILCIATPEGYFLRLNPAAETILGYTRKELMATPIIDFIHPEDLEKTRKTAPILSSQRKLLSFENRYRCKDGTYRWIEWNAASVGDLTYAAGRDVTERKRTEEALRKSEERFRQVAESVTDFIWEVDANGLYRYTSPTVEKILGYRPEELIGKKHFYDLFAPEARKEIKAAALTVFAEKKPFRSFPNLNVSKDGRLVELETSGMPMLDGVGNLAGYRGADTDVSERKQAERALAETQAQMLALFNSTDDMIWSVDPETFGLVTFNSGLRDYFLDRRGMKIQPGMTPDELFPGLPEFSLRWREFYTRALRDGSYVTEYRVAAGTNYLLLSINLLRRDGDVFGISVFGKDITERKLAEEALEERLRFERFLSDLAARVATVSSDQADWEIRAVLEKIIEFFKADRVGLLMASDDRKSWQIAYAAFAEGVPPFPLKTDLPKSLFPWMFDRIVERREMVSVRAVEELPKEADTDKESLRKWGIRSALNIPIVRGEDVGCISITADGSKHGWPESYVPRLRLIGNLLFDALDRMGMEEKIRKFAQEWKSTFDSIPDVILLMDRDLRILRHNAAAVSFFGVPPREIQGQYCHHLMQGEEGPPVDCPAKKSLSMRHHQEAEIYDAKRNAWSLTSSDPIIDGEGQVTQIVYRMKDITSQKRTEIETSAVQRKLQRSERLLRMGELTASLAHELNQPLTSILSNANAALRFIDSDTLSSAEFKEILQDIVDDDKRAGEIIRSLRSMFKQEEGEREPVTINLLLREVVALFKSEAVIRDLRLETEFTDSLLPVHISKVQVQQVVINLMMNAAESIPDASPDRRITVRAYRSDNDYVQVAVRDNGSGIAEEDLTRIFDPFFSKKQTGLGLGLSISRTIIQDHGGHIWAKNNPDKGTTFFFDLPVMGKGSDR